MTRELYSKSGDTIHYWTRDELLARAERAEAARDAALERVAELEAAQGWRPVTEKPPVDADYLGWDGENYVSATYWHEYEDDDLEPQWTDGDGNELVVTHWRPLPPPPDAMLEAATEQDER